MGAERRRDRGGRAPAPRPGRLAGRRQPRPDTGPLTLPLSISSIAAPRALYVHVPFCVSLCPYCDFVVYAGAAARGPRNRIATFVEALRAEIELRADLADARFGPPGSAGRPRLESLYLGGGTPSLLDPAVVVGLIELVDRRFGVAAGAEVTLEANPGRDERGDPAAWREAGVNRISFGAQSLDAGELRRLGRRHTPSDVGDAVAEARAARIGSISVDLLYDMPDQSLASWARSLDAALQLAPDHLSLYPLTLDDPSAEGLTGPSGDHLPTTSGARRWRDRARPDQDEDRAAGMYELASERLAAAGWRGYEISNWARPGHESRHNLVYWQRLPYEAVGPGAHAFDGLTRRWNAARLGAYFGALLPTDEARPSPPPGGSETLDAATAAAEAAILGLRTDRGLAAGAAESPPFEATLAWALDADLLAATGEARLVLTTRGRMLSNEIFERLLPSSTEEELSGHGRRWSSRTGRPRADDGVDTPEARLLRSAPELALS